MGTDFLNEILRQGFWRLGCEFMKTQRVCRVFPILVQMVEFDTNSDPGKVT